MECGRIGESGNRAWGFRLQGFEALGVRVYWFRGFWAQVFQLKACVSLHCFGRLTSVKGVLLLNCPPQTYSYKPNQPGTGGFGVLPRIDLEGRSGTLEAQKLLQKSMGFRIRILR